MNARRKHFSNVREKSCHPEFHIQQNCVSEMQVKFSDEGNLRNLLSADLLYWKQKKNAKGSSSDRKEMTTEGNLEHEEWERAERAWQFSMAVNVDSLKQHTWIRSLGWLSWTLCFKLSAGCNQVPVGLCSFLDLGAFFQTHMVVGRIQFLAVIGLRPSAPTGCPLLPATWPSTGSSYDSSLSYKGSWD